MKNISFMLLIFIFSILYIFIIPPAPTITHILFKIIPMLLILIYAYLNLPLKRVAGHYFIMAGLFFSMLGDATLRWFIVGLSFFLIGHILYIIAFSYFINFKKKHLSFLVILLPYIIWMGTVLTRSFLAEEDVFMIAPVLIYILAIAFMGIMAVFTQDYFLIIGAILFIVSDSILAWDMFISTVEFSGLLIMSTYYLAQFAIATSLPRLKKMTSND